MTVYIRVDVHARQQTFGYLDSSDGTTGQVVLDHEQDDVREFYSQFQGEVIIGMEASGYTNWYEELVEQLGHRWLGIENLCHRIADSHVHVAICVPAENSALGDFAYP
jgi:hypothetical protein